MSFIYKLWAKSPEKEVNQPEQIINQLFTRLKTSSQLQDRRDSLKSLATLIKQYLELIREEYIEIILQVFSQDGENVEVVSLCLRLLTDVITQQKQYENSIGFICKKIILYSHQTLVSMMNLLTSPDKNLRRYALDLLSLLAVDFSGELSHLMFSKSSSVFSVLTDLLEDNWDYIRCSALDLMVLLSETDDDIKKLIVFDSGFHRALNMIKLEGFSTGGQVVEAALRLIQNLIKSNSSNKTAFIEANCLKDFVNFLGLLTEFSSTNITCITYLFNVVDEIVNSANTRINIRRFQTKIAESALLKVIVDITFRPDLPRDLFPRILQTTSSLIRGDNYCQGVFENSFLPLSGKTPASTLTTWLLDSEKSPQTRLCLTNCLRAFLLGNDPAKRAIIQTFLPVSAIKNTTTSTGLMLCGGLLSSDPISVFLSAMVISSCLAGEETLKADLLRVQLSSSPHLPPSLLLYHCAEIVMRDLSLFVAGGMMTLLATWIADCPRAVELVLRMTNFMNFLIGHVCSGEADSTKTGLSSVLLGFLLIYNNDSVPEYSRENILKFVERGCGSIGCFFDRIYLFCRSQVFLSCCTSPNLQINPDSLSLDPQFVDTVIRIRDKIEKFDPHSANLTSNDDNLTKIKQDLQISDRTNEDLSKSAKAWEVEIDRVREEKAALERSHEAAVKGLGDHIARTEEQLQSVSLDLGNWQSAYYAKNDEAVQLRACCEHLKREHDDLLLFLAEREMIGE